MTNLTNVTDMTEIDDGGHRGPRRKLNPKHLAELRKMRSERPIDWEAIDRITRDGTSQGEVSRITGINQGWISRRLRRMQGIEWDEMDQTRRNIKEARKS